MRTFTTLLFALTLTACSSADFTVDNPIGLGLDGEAGETGETRDATEEAGGDARMETSDTGALDTGALDTGASADTGALDTGASTDSGAPDTASTPDADAGPVEKCTPGEAPTAVAGDVAGGSPSSWSGTGEAAILVSLSELDKPTMKDLRGELKFWVDAPDARFEVQIYRGGRKTSDGKMIWNACVGVPEVTLTIAGGPSTKLTELVVTDLPGVYDEQVFTLWVRPTGPTSPTRVWQIMLTGNK